MESNKILKHIAIIPDGNRRWAKKHGLKPWLGHKQGTVLFMDLFKTAMDEGVEYMTFWAASVDNLTKRGSLEVKYLLKILGELLTDEKFVNFIRENQIYFSVLGQWQKIIKDVKLKKNIFDLQKSTQQFSKYHLTILLAYDGKLEMLNAVNDTKRSDRRAEEIDLRKNLQTGYLPDVDLVIRTGGQPHWSAGFMMWLTANSEFYFTQTLWPDFNPKELSMALKDYQTRLRKMGK